MSSFASTNHAAGGLLPAAGLVLVAPLVAEYLLGNMSITQLGMLAILAPLYGGGALLVRETVRRTDRGWPAIFVLALAYGVLEEAFLTQSLFNPNFLGKNLHLLETAYLPELGIGLWYSVFVLTLHMVWSIAVPIALVEALVPRLAASAWLGPVGLAVVAVVFVAACVSVASFTVQMDPSHFVASPGQLIGAAAIVVALVAFSFMLPRRAPRSEVGRRSNPWLLGGASFAAASAFLSIPRGWGWWAVAAELVLVTASVSAIWRRSRRADEAALDRLALAGGAAMAYAIHAFSAVPALGEVARLGNLVFVVLAAGLIAVGATRRS